MRVLIKNWFLSINSKEHCKFFKKIITQNLRFRIKTYFSELWKQNLDNFFLKTLQQNY